MYTMDTSDGQWISILNSMTELDAPLSWDLAGRKDLAEWRESEDNEVLESTSLENGGKEDDKFWVSSIGLIINIVELKVSDPCFDEFSKAVVENVLVHLDHARAVL